MTVLVDSDVVASYLKGRQREVVLLDSLTPQGLAISLITYGEIFEGIYYGRDPTAHDRVFQRFLREVDVLPLNRAIMKQFARIRGELRRNGNLIPDPDILIAATALFHDLALLTRNVKDFQRIPGLSLYR